MSYHHYPPQGGYQNQGYPAQGYPPPTQYAPPPQSYHAQQYSGPQQGYPPPQPYHAPPPGHYPPTNGHYMSPQQSYAAPPPSQYGVQYGAPTPPSPPSLGYAMGQMPYVDTTAEAEGLRKAMKGFGTDEKAIIHILSKLDPVQIASVRQSYNQRFMRDLIRDLEKETSGDFRNALVALACGPLQHDCRVLYAAMKGAGTKESDLNDVLCSRSNADVHAIRAEYRNMFGRDLEADLKADLSIGTETLFLMLVSGRRHEESTPVIPQQIEQATTELQNALGTGPIGMNKNAVHVCQVMTSHSDAELRAIAQTFQQRYHIPLAKAIDSRMSGHMKDALHLMLARALDRPRSDAEMLEEAMKGFGTHDRHLIDRVVRAHWDRRYMGAVKQAYSGLYGKELRRRIEGETRGDYERVLVAMVG